MDENRLMKFFQSNWRLSWLSCFFFYRQQSSHKTHPVVVIFTNRIRKHLYNHSIEFLKLIIAVLHSSIDRSRSFRELLVLRRGGTLNRTTTSDIIESIAFFLSFFLNDNILSCIDGAASCCE